MAPTGTAKLLVAAERWASDQQQNKRARLEPDPTGEPDVVILASADGEDASPDFDHLTEELARLGFRVTRCSWQNAGAADLCATAGCALPLAVWDYSASSAAHARFVALLRELSARGVAPQADFAATAWCSHKEYLLELAEAGIPIVPMELLRAGAGGAELDSAVARLSSSRRSGGGGGGGGGEGGGGGGHRSGSLPSCSPLPRPEADGGLVGLGLTQDLGPETSGPETEFVAKPAVGGRGDGVERLRPLSDLAARRSLLDLLSTRDMLLQPFFSRVTSDGELCALFVNGRLQHVIHKDPHGWGRTVGRSEAEPAAQSAEFGCPLHPCTDDLGSIDNTHRHTHRLHTLPGGGGEPASACTDDLGSTDNTHRHTHLQGAACTDDLGSTDNTHRHTHRLHTLPGGGGEPSPAPREHCSGAQPVRVVALPPAQLVEVAQRVVAHLSRRVGAEATRAGCLYLCRVDFLRSSPR